MRKLSVTQIVLGIFVVGSLFAWMVWISPGYHIREGIIPGSDTVIRSIGLIKPNPLLGVWAVVYPILGLSVFGCGIAQYFKARQQTTHKEDALGSGDESRAVKV
ncbi:hypothetical protein ACFLYG_00945 [Chloroflexota bacterium]